MDRDADPRALTAEVGTPVPREREAPPMLLDVGKAHGLLLIGCTFPSQNVGTVVIFLVLALSYSSRRFTLAR